MASKPVFFLSFFETTPWFIFLMRLTFFILIMTNLIMNVAAISVCLPVALTMTLIWKIKDAIFDSVFRRDA